MSMNQLNMSREQLTVALNVWKAALNKCFENRVEISLEEATVVCEKLERIERKMATPVDESLYARNLRAESEEPWEADISMYRDRAVVK